MEIRLNIEDGTFEQEIVEKLKRNIYRQVKEEIEKQAVEQVAKKVAEELSELSIRNHVIKAVNGEISRTVVRETLDGWRDFNKRVFDKENYYDEWPETEKAFHAGAQSAYLALKNGLNVSEEYVERNVFKYVAEKIASRIRMNPKNMDKLAQAIADLKDGEGDDNV